MGVVVLLARLYTRVSTDEQAQFGYSLSAQMERIEAFCVSQGWTVGGRYTDDGVSAKDLKRQSFQRMMEDAKPGDVLVVYKLDRLTRSVRDLDDLLRTFEQRNLLFRSVTEQFDTTTATGRLFIRMVAEMAQWERETIAERSAFGKRKKRSAGEWNGGKAPFGYRAVPSETVKNGRQMLRLEPDENAHLIPQIFDRYLSGLGARGVAKWLNDSGVRAPQGGRFHVPVVARILTNPMYCGDVHHGRGKQQRLPTERIASTHIPLISRETFERVSALMAERKTYAPRQATGKYPLAGVARCGLCGRRIDGVAGGPRSSGYYYRCHSVLTGEGCSFKFINGAAAEELLLNELVQEFAGEGVARFVRQWEAELASRYGNVSDEIARLERDLRDSENAVANYKRLFENGKIGDDEYVADITPHKEMIARVKELLREAKERVVVPPSHDALSEIALSLRRAWKNLEPPERKSMVQEFTRLGVKILVSHHRVVLAPDVPAR